MALASVPNAAASLHFDGREICLMPSEWNIRRFFNDLWAVSKRHMTFEMPQTSSNSLFFLMHLLARFAYDKKKEEKTFEEFLLEMQTVHHRPFKNPLTITGDPDLWLGLEAQPKDFEDFATPKDVADALFAIKDSQSPKFFSDWSRGRISAEEFQDFLSFAYRLFLPKALS